MNNPVKTIRQEGFTLIELLIVVAIIAILAAIAVPNFLEAQNRTKVSRVRSDFRTIATALEAYAVDHNDYPRNWRVGDQTLTPDLSTPVAYLTTKDVHDPFGEYVTTYSDSRVYGYHRIVRLRKALTIPFPWTPDGTAVHCEVDSPILVGNPGALQKYGQWLLHSIGPDGVWHQDADNIWDFWESHDTLYDPTNGTKSFGNLVRTQLHPEGKIPFSRPK